MEEYKTPRDKMIAIINTCKIISNMVYNSKNNGQPTGADEFLPMLIYLVLKTNLKKTNSSVSFIVDFRSEKRLKGLEEYYFTAFQSAIEFIETLDETKLKIDPQEHESKYKKNFKLY